MAAKAFARRPAASALLTVLALVALLRLRGPEAVVRHRAVRITGPASHALGPGLPRRTPAGRTPSPSRTPTVRPAPAAPAAPRTATAPPAATSAPAPAPARTTAPPSRSYTGDTFDTRYGPVQVRMTVQGSRITDVVALQLPNDRSRSREISDYAAPRLRQEALDAQSANIDTVSGATYTSDGYASSLQSAIDQWRP
jgi:uncharacterized protein with FMN-binding domain